MNRLASITGAAAAALIVAAPAAADVAVSSDPTAGSLSALDGVVLWTRSEMPDPYGLEQFRLVARARGRTSDLRIKAFLHPVSADLGRNASGGLVAVYDRCRIGAGGLPNCDLYEYSFGTRRERRLRSLSTRRRAESAGSRWGRQYTFMRYNRTLGFHFFERDAGIYRSRGPTRISGDLADQTDLRGGLVAWSVGNHFRPGRETAVRLTRLAGGRVCTVANARRGEEAGESVTQVSDAIIAGGRIWWLFQRLARAGDPSSPATAYVRRTRHPDSRCRRRGPVETTGSLRRAQVGVRVTSLAVDRGRIYYTVRGGDPDADGVRMLTGARFRRLR